MHTGVNHFYKDFIENTGQSVLYTADEGLWAEMSCTRIQLLYNLLRIAHKLFTYNTEPLKASFVIEQHTYLQYKD